VLHNRESSALQYAMQDRLTALGWSEIEVIDDDLGRSAAGSVQRAGFERMVAEVCLKCARPSSAISRPHVTRPIAPSGNMTLPTLQIVSWQANWRHAGTGRSLMSRKWKARSPLMTPHGQDLPPIRRHSPCSRPI
jgi:hypothetical protein